MPRYFFNHRTPAGVTEVDIDGLKLESLNSALDEAAFAAKAAVSMADEPLEGVFRDRGRRSRASGTRALCSDRRRKRVRSASAADLKLGRSLARSSGMKTLRLILGDQLSGDITSLDGLDPATDVIVMVEIADETTYAPHHKQKLVLVLSAMRHFAQALRDDGFAVDYIGLEDSGNSGNFTGEIQRAIERHSPDRIVVTEASEYRVVDMMRDWATFLSVPIDIRPDTRFLCTHDEFAAWAEGKKSLLMEFFYRDMRRKTGLLMDQGPAGRWSVEFRRGEPQKSAEVRSPAAPASLFCRMK